jgi:Putative zinc-finger
MKCDKTTELLDEYIDDLLSPEQRSLIQAHLSSCESCRQELGALLSLREALRKLPVRPPPAGFAERILRTAKRDYNRRHMGVFASGAAAAGLLIMLVAGVMQMTSQDAVRTDVIAVQMVELNVLEQRTISLAFNSPVEIDDVTFTLKLPEGVELSGHPDQQELVWKDTLSNGRNVLQLTLRGQKQINGTLQASIEHAGSRREFNIALHVREAGASLLSLPGMTV